jgi:hypothetical protein
MRPDALPWSDAVVAGAFERPTVLAPALLEPDMPWPIAIAGLLLIAVGIGMVVLTITGRDSGKLGYGPYSPKQILTDNELEFYHRLRRGLPGRVILCQVSMSALIEPRDLPERTAEYMRLRARFAQKYVDFVICEPESLSVIAIVELDDITHDPVKDAQRDAMLGSAGYRVVRWHSRKKPSPSEIGRHFARLAAD